MLVAHSFLSPLCLFSWEGYPGSMSNQHKCGFFLLSYCFGGKSLSRLWPWQLSLIFELSLDFLYCWAHPFCMFGYSRTFIDSFASIAYGSTTISFLHVSYFYRQSRYLHYMSCHVSIILFRARGAQCSQVLIDVQTKSAWSLQHELPLHTFRQSKCAGLNFPWPLRLVPSPSILSLVAILTYTSL